MPPQECRVRSRASPSSLNPLGFSQLFGVPMSLIANGGFDAACILGATTMSLWNRLGECQTFRERVLIIESFLLRALTTIRRADPIGEISNYILELTGNISVAQLARHAGMSVRH